MIREATAMEVRNNLGELLNRIRYRRDSVLISKSGHPIAALIDPAMFERIRRLEKEFIRLTDKLAQASELVGDAELESLVDEAVSAVRSKR